MPELPEVETTIRYLAPYLRKIPIRNIFLGQHGSGIFNQSADTIRERLVGNQIDKLDRHGKFILITFSQPRPNMAKYAVAHLRMSGRYKVSRKNYDHPHLRFTLALADGYHVHYIDQRRFGTFHFVEDFSYYPGLARLGDDAWSHDLNAQQLYQQLQRRSIPIHTALQDQSLIAGLGNIYVNEVLFRAGISPQRSANSLAVGELQEIVNNVRPLLSEALKLKGTTLIDNLYQDPGGSEGAFAKMLQVYGREGEKCLRCNGVIQREKVGGRSAYYCLGCQK